MRALLLFVGYERRNRRVEKNESERERKGRKLLRLKMEGNGIVIWRVNAEIKL